MDTRDDDEEDEAFVPPPFAGQEPAIAAAIRARMFPGIEPSKSGDMRRSELHRGQFHQIGRFTVLRELGRGGMGVVYACYDEQLDRKVAVKLLRTRLANERARVRLAREGQALARLSHPNVVQIYELGDHHGELFVAMEYVVGQTLRAWLASRRVAGVAHAWREIAAVLREAGAGLAAAHAAGLVHRDFKPDNVIVGSDGRVRVLDFGLVRYATDAEGLVTRDDSDPVLPTEIEQTPADLGTAPTGLLALTRVGSVMGTPAYMAPEQFMALDCDTASDQFSFCVVAFEGLFGRRPFAGETMRELEGAVRSGTLAPIPADSSVPKSLRAAIRRGLAPNPSERWPDLASLLAEFDRALAGPRRVWQFAAGLGLAAVCGGAAAITTMSERPQSCSFDEAALLGVWDDDDREALRAAASGEQGLGEQSIAAIDDALTDWGERWLASSQRNCEATRVIGSQSEATLDLRAGCLERQRREVAAIAEQLLRPDGASMRHAFELVEQLPDLGVCDEPGLATAPYPLPTQAELREAILATYEQVSAARSLATINHLDEARELVAAVSAEAEQLDYLPLQLEAAYLQAQQLFWLGELDGAVTALRASVRRAEVAGLDELSASMRTTLAGEIAGTWGEPGFQEAALDEAELALARLGRPDDPRQGALDRARAAWVEDRGEFETALAMHEANAASARARGQHAQVGRALQQRGRLLLALGRVDPAELAFQDARAAYAEVYGPGSLDDAHVLVDLAVLELGRARLDDAQALLDAVERDHAKLLEPGTDVYAIVELTRGKIALFRGDHEAAAARFSRVIATGNDDEHLGEAWQNLGVARFYLGDMSGSIDAYRKARAQYVQTLGPGHPDIGIIDSNIGESLAASGDHQGALEAYDDALDCLERGLPPDHPNFALPYKGRGQSRLALGQLDGARVDLEHALRIHEANPGEPLDHADVEFSLARVLAGAGESSRARDLAASARARLLALGQVDLAAPIDAWLSESP